MSLSTTNTRSLLACATALALSSCEPPKTTARPHRQEIATPAASINRAYVYGTVVSFGKDGGSERFRCGGWSDAEPEFTWTVGASSRLIFRVAPTRRPLEFRMRASGFTNPPELPSQPVEVWANGYKQGDWLVSETANYRIQIPPELVRAGGELTLEFKVPNAASPSTFGVSTDVRILGIRCFECQLTEI